MAKTYEAMMKGNLANPVNTSYIEFENKKQSGDLDKKINFYHQKNDSKIFNFTSSRNKEGVSTIIVNLTRYIALKKTGKKVILIDANFQNPVLHNALGLSMGKGLLDCLTEDINPEEVIQKVPDSQIDFISCGSGYGKIAGGVDQEKFSNILKILKETYDIILLDSPPLLTSSDSLAPAVAADVTFLVVESLKTQKEVATRAKMLLEDNECLIGGVLLNRVQQVIPAWMYKVI